MTEQMNNQENIDSKLGEFGFNEKQLQELESQVKEELLKGLDFLKDNNVFGQNFIDALIKNKPIDLDGDGKFVEINLPLNEIVSIINEIKNIGIEKNQLQIKEYIISLDNLKSLEKAILENNLKTSLSSLKEDIINSAQIKYGKMVKFQEVLSDNQIFNNLSPETQSKLVKFLEILNSKGLSLMRESGLNFINPITLNNMLSGFIISLINEFKNIDIKSPGLLKSYLDKLDLNNLSTINNREFFQTISSLVEGSNEFIVDLNKALIEVKDIIGDGSKSSLLTDPIKFRNMYQEYINASGIDKTNFLKDKLLNSISNNYLYAGLDNSQKKYLDSAIVSASGVVGTKGIENIMNQVQSFQSVGKTELLKNADQIVGIKDMLEGFGLWGNGMKDLFQFILKIFGFSSYDEFESLHLSNIIQINEVDSKNISAIYNGYIAAINTGTIKTDTNIDSIISGLKSYSNLSPEQKQLFGSFSLSEFESNFPESINPSLIKKYGKDIGIEYTEGKEIVLSDEDKSKLIKLFVSDELNNIMGNKNLLNSITNTNDIVYYLSFISQKLDIAENSKVKVFKLKNKFNLNQVETKTA